MDHEWNENRTLMNLRLLPVATLYKETTVGHVIALVYSTELYKFEFDGIGNAFYRDG